jgi:hypothetical protein
MTMSSTDYSTTDDSRGRCFRGDMRNCCGGHWSGANILAMVAGFIIFAPLGFVVLVWTLLGRPIQEFPGWVREKWARFSGGRTAWTYGGSENSVFNEYQQTQHDRIREIREEIRNRAEAFRQFRADARRRKERQEFEDFMSSRPHNGHGES